MLEKPLTRESKNKLKSYIALDDKDLNTDYPYIHHQIMNKRNSRKYLSHYCVSLNFKAFYWNQTDGSRQ